MNIETQDLVFLRGHSSKLLTARVISITYQASLDRMKLEPVSYRGHVLTGNDDREAIVEFENAQVLDVLKYKGEEVTL